MILKLLPNTLPYDTCAMAVKLDTNTVQIPTPDYEREFCYCAYDCGCDITVFGGSLDSINNDKTSFLFKKETALDTIDMFLYKDGIQIATLNNNALGEYFNNVGVQSLLVGYVIDWNLVYNTFGIGCYYIKSEYVIVGINAIFESEHFNLMQFSEERADGTVKIEWWQDGEILNGFNFTGLNWYNSIRLKADMLVQTPEYVQENYITTNRNTTQIQASIVQKWELICYMLCKQLKDILICDMVLANRILLTNFNLFQEVIVQQEVNVSNITELSQYEANRNFRVKIEFEDRSKAKLKRNC